MLPFNFTILTESQNKQDVDLENTLENEATDKVADVLGIAGLLIAYFRDGECMKSARKLDESSGTFSSAQQSQMVDRSAAASTAAPALAILTHPQLRHFPPSRLPCSVEYRLIITVVVCYTPLY